MADGKICSPKAIEVGYRANIHLPAEPNAVCCEVAGTVGQRIFDGQRILDGQRIFDVVSRVLAADMSALADGQHTLQSLRKTSCVNLLVPPLHEISVCLFPCIICLVMISGLSRSIPTILM